MKKDNIWGCSIDVAVFRREVVVLITNSKEYLIEELENVLLEDLSTQVSDLDFKPFEHTL